jgi:hypothetical protein
MATSSQNKENVDRPLNTDREQLLSRHERANGSVIVFPLAADW